MARITELQDGSDSDSGPSRTAGGKPEMLTQAEREQILFESGAIEKLGLPKDFITLEEAQAQLAAQKAGGAARSGGVGKSTSASASASVSGAAFREQEARRRLAKQQQREAAKKHPGGVELGSDDSEDEYGAPSDIDYNEEDDTADRLLREQEANEMSQGVESVLDLLIWTMPFGFMYTLLDVLVRQQYGETVGFFDQGKRLVGAIPLLALFIYYNLTSRRKVLLQVILFSISVVCGCSLIYIVNKSPYDVVVQRVAPLGTLWIFAVVRLDLLPACVGLAIVAGFVQHQHLKIVFD
ncbi:hypothetical protein BCV70DRAFT_216671 [Testicularia cyperi]|uniref:DUF7719 domain-containing protein n=1 Tax=Testicularia cyperi TaxID=1882483 RepID=A0A317XQA9_9BASI|nr:hypothetical protein BCV70DRAFT_216671 [Testicularia cyperi]